MWRRLVPLPRGKKSPSRSEIKDHKDSKPQHPSALQPGKDQREEMEMNPA